jgi:glycosyltransferase involved in cell wall biosynthesis
VTAPPLAPHLSLIVPVFNGADRLPASLEELRAFLRAQSYSWELILVDDCSGAEARAILECFAGANAGVRLIRNEENRG